MWNKFSICSIPAIIRARLTPPHKLECPRSLWRNILKELNKRGENRHEAGAFLLGAKEKGRLQVREAVFYDDLDANAYASGVCVLHADAFAKLWDICREKGVTVVGDVHTHCGAAFQSQSDRTNPMVARKGHIALIVPNYATAPVRRASMGVYEYRGAHSWTDYSRRRAKKYFRINIWR